MEVESDGEYIDTWKYGLFVLRNVKAKFDRSVLIVIHVFLILKYLYLVEIDFDIFRVGGGWCH